MAEFLLSVVVVFLTAVIGFQVALSLRKVGVELSPLQHALEVIGKSCERVEQAVPDEIVKNHSEASAGRRCSPLDNRRNCLEASGDIVEWVAPNLLLRPDEGRDEGIRDDVIIPACRLYLM